MKKEYKIFILIEKILNTLNNSRLEYIKAADKSPYPEYKRFLNKTATTRNRLCQDLMVVFRLYYNAPENLVLNRIDHKKIVTTPNKSLKKNHSDVIIDIDLKLIKLYKEIIEKNDFSEILNNHLGHIVDSIKTNKNLIKDRELVFYH